MPFQVRCSNPQCDAFLSVPAEAVGTRVRCPKCGTRVLWLGAGAGCPSPPPPSTPAVSPAAATAAKTLPLTLDLRWNLMASLAWMAVALVLARLAPWLGLWPGWLAETLNSLPVVATLALIGWNLIMAFRVVGWTGHPLAALPLTVVQFFLFTLLFLQIGQHLGAQHYELHAAPGLADWFGFSLAHALRAVDLFDTVEIYGWNVQRIESASHFTSLCLIAFHLIMDLFLLTFLVQLAKRLVFANAEEYRAIDFFGYRLTVSQFLLATLAALALIWSAGAYFLRPQDAPPIVFWLLDNLIHVLDFTDGFAIYRVRLYDVPRTMWDDTLTLLFRINLVLLAGGVLGATFSALSIRWLGGFGLHREELEAIRNARDDPALARSADRRLKKMAVTEAFAADIVLRPWRDPKLSVVTGLTLAAAALALLVEP
jgi:hypothetical protein